MGLFDNVNSEVPIQETFTLPSHGKIYTENVNENFTMRSMTINEEMQRLQQSQHVYETLCKIIDKCMVQGPGISSYDMCLGDYIYCLYMLRIVTYGPIYKIRPECRYCKTIINDEFNLHDLKINEYTDDIMKYIEFKLPDCGRTVMIQPQTPRSLDIISDQVKMYQRKMSNSLDSSIMCQVMSSIKMVDGVELDSISIESFVRKLSMMDVITILNYQSKLNDFIGIDNEIVIKCDMCGMEQHAQLAITSEFFRPTLDI